MKDEWMIQEDSLRHTLYDFLGKMAYRLRRKECQGFRGWNDRSLITDEELYVRLIGSAREGKFIDAANFAMMLQHRKESSVNGA